MCRLLLSITAWHHLLHERINVLYSSTDIFSHSSFKLIHSSSTFLGFLFLALSFSNFQTFSIGFISGLWAGHSITVTSSSERNVLTDFAVWHGALSCINTTGWLIGVLKLGTTCFFNISLYTWELIFIYCGLFVLILVGFFVLFLLSLRFGQISPLTFFRWFTATSDRITAFHSRQKSPQ